MSSHFGQKMLTVLCPGRSEVPTGRQACPSQRALLIEKKGRFLMRRLTCRTAQNSQGKHMPRQWMYRIKSACTARWLCGVPHCYTCHIAAQHLHFGGNACRYNPKALCCCCSMPNTPTHRLTFVHLLPALSPSTPNPACITPHPLGV
jgi:hypothetical protein